MSSTVFVQNIDRSMAEIALDVLELFIQICLEGTHDVGSPPGVACWNHVGTAILSY